MRPAEEMPPDEAGFTLVELLVACVISSIVISGLGAALVMGIRLRPTVDDRSQFGGSAAILTTKISDDVANATTVDPLGWSYDANGLPCDAGSKEVGKFNGSTSREVRYSLIVDNTPIVGTTTTTYQVTVVRNDADGGDVLLTGYCQHSVNIGRGAIYDPIKLLYTLDLNLQVASEGERREVSFSVARRAGVTGTVNLPPIVLTGTVYGNLNDGLSGWTITVTSSSGSLQATTDGNGAYSLAVPAGSSYQICETPPTGQTWYQIWPQSSPLCSANWYGYTASVSTSGLDFRNENLNYKVNCSLVTVNALNTVNGYWPGNHGPDYIVRLDQGKVLQTYVDAAQDVNGDGEILVMAWGNATQRVTVSKPYSARFGLLGCGSNSQLQAPGGSTQATILVTSGASASPTTIATAASGTADIVMVNLYARNSNVAGIEIDGTNRYSRSQQSNSNTGFGFLVKGASNTIDAAQVNGTVTGPGIQFGNATFPADDGKIINSGTIDGNNGDGINAVGNRITINQGTVGTKNDRNTGDGIDLTGDSAKIGQMLALGNSGNGILVTGNSNTIGFGGGNIAGKSPTEYNSKDGIKVVGTGNFVINANSVDGNLNNGISVSGGTGNKIDGNAVGGQKPNALDGIKVTTGSNTVSNNAVDSSGGNGITIAGNSNTVSSNTVGQSTRNTGDGINVAGASNVISANKVNNSGGDGFDVSGAATSGTANSLQNNQSAGNTENAGAEYRLAGFITNNGTNKADGIVVPKTTAPVKCNAAPALFPTGTVNVAAGQGVCE